MVSGVSFSLGDTEVLLRELTLGGGLVFMLLISLVATVTLLLVWHMRALFFCYEQGEIFTECTVYRIKKIGQILLLGAIVRFLECLVFVPGILYMAQKHSFSTSADLPLGLLIAGLLVSLISWIMDEGRKLKNEYDLTV